ncbi:sigma 54-interacting transcriptional regulator [Segatella copri]|uniref:sigma 54-interacting transcriptional regulator n=1 Tax=Segatella copri TaxID=165179 RepID=UPI002230B9E4|nr:sigma 54-interacting transcriptional regulator [Segatella copri]MCW4074848.1 sigma 54-interacting transcriptional regulator [Segatella copri]
MDTSELQKIKQRYNIVGNSDGLNHALDVALQVAPTDLSVLIIGESGVGKEIIPRVIHDNSPRRREKYFAINCGSIPEGTIDSELFGHEKGSFTGAIGESEGYFGIANKGTIFLDEVGELPIQTQARLLRVLETGEYIRVGGTEIKKTDVRIVAATNVNMRKAMSEGKFREDLYYRLNNICIQMPALRERGNDILLLFRLFAMQMAERYRLPKISLTDEAKQIMLKYKWPGNVRQLKNITEQMSVLSREREIDAQTLTQFIPRDEESTQLATIQKDGNDDHSYASERELLYKILYELRGNVSDLRREMNSLRKQLDEARQLGGTSGYVSPVQPSTQVAPVSAVTPVSSVPSVSSVSPVSSVSSVSPVPSVPPITDLDELQHIRQEMAAGGIRGTYKPEAEDAEIEEIKEENENLNLSDLSKQMIEKALERNNGNRKKAAEELGISDRTLYRKINKYKL